jgi:cell division protease FtsH
VFGDVSTGAHDDLRKVSDMARAMVTTYGMSDDIGLLTYDQPSSSSLPGITPTPPKTYSEDTARQIDMEVRAIVDQAHEQVWQLLSEKKSALERLARRLLDHEVLEGAELHALLTPQPAPLGAACSPRAQEA